MVSGFLSSPPRWREWRWIAALLGLLTLWWLWPLCWMLLTSPALGRQERDAAALFAAAPRAYFTGAVVKVSGPARGVQGRSLMRSEAQLDEYLAARGWTFADQMGAARFYRRPGQRLDSVCGKFSLYFSVCRVSPPESE